MVDLWIEFNNLTLGWFWDMPEDRRHKLVMSVAILCVILSAAIFSMDRMAYQEAAAQCNRITRFNETEFILGMTENAGQNGLYEIEGINKDDKD